MPSGDVGGDLVDFVEMPLDEVSGTIRSAGEPFHDDADVYLELLDPVTYRRATLSWQSERMS